jgi:hypothetical protein
METVTSREQVYPDTKLFIDGSWRDGTSGKVEPVLNPATGKFIGTVAHASILDLDHALESAFRRDEIDTGALRSGNAVDVVQSRPEQGQVLLFGKRPRLHSGYAATLIAEWHEEPVSSGERRPDPDDTVLVVCAGTPEQDIPAEFSHEAVPDLGVFGPTARKGPEPPCLGHVERQAAG